MSIGRTVGCHDRRYAGRRTGCARARRFLELAERALDGRRRSSPPLPSVATSFRCLGADLGEPVLALELVLDLVGIGNRGLAEIGADMRSRRSLVSAAGCQSQAGLPASAAQRLDGVDRDLLLLVAEQHGVQHHRFGQFLRIGLDHQHGMLGTGDHEIECGLRVVTQGRVEDEIAVDITDLRAAPIGPLNGHRTAPAPPRNR
jgi:hypothetical protein